MPLLAWHDRMSVGIASIDEQHKKLVALLNELGESIKAGKDKEALGSILDGLIAYTTTHFKYEEALFAKTAYPDLVDHRKKHNDLIKKTLEIQAKHKTGSGGTLSLEVMVFLRDWLVEHIMGTDQKYAPYLIAKGIK